MLMTDLLLCAFWGREGGGSQRHGAAGAADDAHRRLVRAARLPARGPRPPQRPAARTPPRKGVLMIHPDVGGTFTIYTMHTACWMHMGSVG